MSIQSEINRLNVAKSEILTSLSNKGIDTSGVNTLDDIAPLINQLPTNESLLNLIYPVGSYYETSDDNFNPNNAWVGTWILENDGTTLVSKKATSGSKFNVTTGTIVGSETHTLTIEEMPSHGHNLFANSDVGAYAGNGYWNLPSGFEGVNYGQRVDIYKYNTGAKETGGGLAHNIVQPSKVINRWHRIS